MRRLYYIIPLSLLLCTSFFSCEKTESVKVITPDSPILPAQVMDYRDIKLSQAFGSQFNNSNPLSQFLDGESINFSGSAKAPNPKVTNEGATLGRVLFYDKKLSLNNSISCAGCHHQSKGFADGLSSSPGFEGRLTPRSSMGIVNAALNNGMFWDSREDNVNAMTLNPVQNHIEMGMEDLDFLEKKLVGVDYYPELFKKAFGNSGITKERISSAIAQFLCSMVTSNSKYDQGVSLNFSNFTALEKMGQDLFLNKANCASCHGGANFSVANSNMFSGYESTKGTANIGLDIVYKDQGFGQGQFKIPSLRNIGLTAPYMHDGRFANLEQVIKHYNEDIKPHKSLDRKFLRNGAPIKLGLKQIEIDALVAFLNTLTDETFVKDPRYSDPFKP